MRLLAPFQAAAGRTYSLPETSTAQAIRAVLAACAITATFIGRRARISRRHFVARSSRERALRISVTAPSAKSLRSRLSPCRLRPLIRRLPAVLASRGVRPAQAAKSRAEPNWRPSPIAVTIACAVRNPTPGIFMSRRMSAFSLAAMTISSSSAAIAGDKLSI